MRYGKLLFWIAMVCFVGSGFPLWGQATTSLHGVVTDPSGAAIAGATVTLIQPDTGRRQSTVANARGAYSFPAVLPGLYRLKITAHGFKTYVATGLSLMVSLPATDNIRLSLGSVSQTVEVGGHAPLLNSTDASIGQTMGTRPIENLPMQAENMPLLLSFQPGVVYTGQNNLESSTDTRAGSVNGERSDQNNITLDGVSNNFTFAGYAFNGVLPTTPFSTQEFRVTTSNYGATQGFSAGAQITMVTKSGTNSFHGNLYEFNRNTLGEANDWFLKQSQIEAGHPNRPTRLVRNVYGVAVGGPIVRNRAFFFFNYEGQRISQAASVLRNIPSSTLRDGIIEYTCKSTSSCPGGSVAGLSGRDYSVPAGSYALSPQQLTAMDPLNLGPSAVALRYFNAYPTPNAPAVLDAPNYAGYRFASPNTSDDNWYIGRIDYVINNQNSLFIRGTAVDDNAVDAGPFLPGDRAELAGIDLSKGVAAGLTTVLNPNLVNELRYGLTRESIGSDGNSNEPWVVMRDLDQGITRTSSSTTPVNNIVDTFNWQRGSHRFQFGVNALLIRRNDASNGNSFSSAETNADWVDGGGFAGTGNALDPAAYGYPAVASANAYDFPLAAMMGMATEVLSQYNYKVTGLNTSEALAQGAKVVRHWATDTYNFYFADTWQALPSLSISYGVNYQLMTPITEVDGQQVEPNINMGQWFFEREANMLKGIGSNHDALISFAPAGSHWGRSGMYSMQDKNIAPRFGLAWTPRPSQGWAKALLGDGLTSVRTGFGMYYDNFGPALATNYDASGSFGLTTQLESPFGISIADVPRITGMNSIPTTDNSGGAMLRPAPPSTFPTTYPVGSEAIGTGIDQSLKTPYSYAVDLSIERQLPGRMVLSLGYVGHFGHRGLALEDIAAPMDLVDPNTGIDYFAAATALAKLYRQGIPMSQITADRVGPTASYWMDMFKASASGYSGPATGAANQLQAAYAWFAHHRNNETSALYDLDVLNHAPTPVGGANSYYNSQFSSLWAWRSISNSNYNSLQVSLHKQFSQGVLFSLNYTYSHSLDVASFAERAAQFLTSSIINAWKPNQMYASSNFDVRHQINAYWVAQLPFGRGRLIGGNADRVLDAAIGGWQLAGTTRWTSGFPFSVYMGYVWPTNWDEMGWANLIHPVATGNAIRNGSPNVFKNAVAASGSFDYAYPGQSGQRDNLRGDGYYDTDMNLSKSFATFHGQTLQIRWQVFNVWNTHRFDVAGISDDVDAGPTFGNYTSLLTDPRTMEFGGVYHF